MTHSQDPVYTMLNNIYEMEKAMIPLLENQVKDAKNYPHIGKYVKKLLKESETQAQKAREYMDALEGKVVSSIDTLVSGSTPFGVGSKLANS